MKINFEVDCTPEELRRAFGLPDVKPMQDAVMARLEQQLLEAMMAQSPEAILKAWLPYWLPFMGQSPEQIQKAITLFLATPFNSPPSSKQ